MLSKEVPKSAQDQTFSSEEQRELVSFFTTLFQIDSDLREKNNNTEKDDMSKKESNETQ